MRPDLALAVDLGKMRDPTALVVMEKPPEAERYLVTFAERLPLGTDYPDVTNHIHALAKRLWFLDCELCIDAGAAGLAVIDELRRRGVRSVHGVTMTAGESATRKRMQGGHEDWTVSRSKLFRDLSAAVYARKIEVAPVPYRQALLQELGDLELRIQPSGAQRIEVPDTASITHHADLAVATALAYWRLSTKPGFVEFGSFNTLRR